MSLRWSQAVGSPRASVAAFRYAEVAPKLKYCLVNDARFAETPGFLETELRFKENIEVLRGLVRHR